MRKSCHAAFAAAVFLSWGTVPTQAQCWTETTEVFSPAGGFSPKFGWRVAAHGDTAVVTGFPSITLLGKVFLLERDLGGPGAWGSIELVPSTGNLDYSHVSVAIHGDIVAVGYPKYEFASGGPQLGEVFIYERDQGGPGQWGEVQVLTASDAIPADKFGISVALSGSTLAAGATGPAASSGSEAVYVFERGPSGVWDEITKLQLAGSGNLGDLVALEADTLVAGTGSVAEVFMRDQGGPDQWGHVAKLDSPAINSQLLDSLALSGDTVVTGRIWEDSPGTNMKPGAAFVFERNLGGPDAWGLSKKIVAATTTVGDEFGTSVAIAGDKVFVGAPFDELSGPDAGSVYAFQRDLGGADNWGEVARYSPAESAAGSEYGTSLGLHGGTLVVGSPRRNEGHPGILGLAHEPASGTIYGTTRDVTMELVAIDPSTGAASTVGSTAPHEIKGLAWDPGTGRLYGADSTTSSLVTIDVTTAAVTTVGPLGFNSAHGLAFDSSSGTLYGSITGPDELITIDPATGAGTTVGKLGFGQVRGLGFDPGTGTLYGTDIQSDQLLVIDTTTGAGTAVGSLGFGSVSGLTFEGLSGLLYGTDAAIDEYLSIDSSTGAGTSVANLGAEAVGAVVVLDRTPIVNYCTAGVSASGCQALVQASGIPSASLASGFTLSIPSIEGAKNGFFLYGTNGRQANPWGSGTSYICVIPPRLRGGLMTGVGTQGQCDGSFSQDLNARWCPTCPKPAHNPSAGEVMQAQFWYRDPLSTSNQSSSLSDAVEFTICP